MHLLITAGPTREPIDDVRFISNRSSGAMGLALAEAAVAAGHEVTLLLGPGPSEPDSGPSLSVHRFTTTAELAALLDAHFPRCDALVMAAAVSDYRPVRIEPGKHKRTGEGSGEPGQRWTLELEPTPDLVAALGGRKRSDQKVVAFALESPAELEARAAEKLRRKGADAIVANPLVTMDAPDIEAMWLTAAGSHETPGAMSKGAFARWLIDRVAGL